MEMMMTIRIQGFLVQTLLSQEGIMDKAAIEKLLSSLTASDFGWRCDLPHDTAQFLGHPVSIEIHTRHIPEDGPPPRAGR